MTKADPPERSMAKLVVNVRPYRSAAMPASTLPAAPAPNVANAAALDRSIRPTKRAPVRSG